MSSRVNSSNSNTARLAEVARQRREQAAQQAIKQEQSAKQVQQDKSKATSQVQKNNYVQKTDPTQQLKQLEQGQATEGQPKARHFAKLNPPAPMFHAPQSISTASSSQQARTVARRSFGKLSPPSSSSLGQGIAQAAESQASIPHPKASQTEARIPHPSSAQAQSSPQSSATNSENATNETNSSGGWFSNIVDRVKDAVHNATDSIQETAETQAAQAPEPLAEQESATRLEQFQEDLAEFGLNDDQLESLTTQATQALDSRNSAGERLENGLDLINSLADTLPPEKLDQLPGLVQGISETLPAAQGFAGLANTLADPNSSTVDKAQAALDFADDAGALLSDERREKLSNTLEKFQVGADAVNLVNTLSDPNASNLDKAKATADFANEFGELLPEGSRRREFFNSAGKLGAPINTVENVLTITNPDASLVEKGQAFVDLVGGLGDSVDSIKDIGKSLDKLGVSSALGLGEGSNARRIFNATADALDSVAGKLGAKIGPELLQSAGKALGKALPALGAVISGYDTYRLGKIAVDGDLPGEIRYIAGLGAGINAADTALAVTEALGIGNIGLPANLGLAAAGFAADVATHKLLQDHENGDFNPSDELRAFIGASAVLQGPPGLANLHNAFGIDGSIGVLKDTVKVGGKYAGQAAEALFDFVKDKGEEYIREVGEFVADLPGEVRDQIGGAIEGAKDLFGDAFGAFTDGLGDAVDFFGDLIPDFKIRIPGL